MFVGRWLCSCAVVQCVTELLSRQLTFNFNGTVNFNQHVQYDWIDASIQARTFFTLTRNNHDFRFNTRSLFDIQFYL